LDRLQTKINDRHIFDSFLVDTYIHAMDGDEIKVVVSSGLASNLLSTKYIDVPKTPKPLFHSNSSEK
jgi:hypothetical protein